LIGTWQVASSAGLLPSQILPAPTAVLKAGAELTADGELPHHLAVSTGRALTGLAAGGIISFALGLLCGLSPFARRLLDPTLQMVRTIPHLALLP
ncbi:aliphatic sulfonate ABC transporter permease SsuC, partial [Escherichia coli]